MKSGFQTRQGKANLDKDTGVGMSERSFSDYT